MLYEQPFSETRIPLLLPWLRVVGSLVTCSVQHEQGNLA